MIARIWNTKTVVNRKDELIKFANEVSKPYLASQKGNKGVFFFSKDDDWVTLTLWESEEDIARMEKDPKYSDLVKRIYQLNALHGDSTTKLFEVH